MLRRVFHFGLAALIGVVAFSTSTIVGQDKVERRDPKGSKSAVVQGKILEEKIDGIKMKVGAKEEVIPSTEIVRISYDDIPPLAKQGNAALFNTEDTEKDHAKLLKTVQDLNDKAKGGPAGARRYYEFKLAMLQGAWAETEAQKEGAIKALQSFVSAHAASWEYPFAVRALARLHINKSDYDSASKLLEAVAKSELVPADLRAEANFMLIDALFQQPNKVDELKAKLAAAMGSPKLPEAQKSRYTVYQIGVDSLAPDAKIDDSIKKLEDIIAKPTTDNGVKALAYNVMGDCYMSKARKRDAMWAYLWVDVVYNQDKSEHLKSIFKLIKIFDDMEEKEKAQMYRDKQARFK